MIIEYTIMVFALWLMVNYIACSVLMSYDLEDYRVYSWLISTIIFLGGWLYAQTI